MGGRGRGGEGEGGGMGSGFGFGTGGVAEKMLREGAPAGPSGYTETLDVGGWSPAETAAMMVSPSLPPPDASQQQQRQLWAALQRDRARLEQQLADARRQLSSSAVAKQPTVDRHP